MDVEELVAEIIELETKNRALRKACKLLLPVAKETCKRWPNDDCYLAPVAKAEALIAKAKS